MLPDAASRLRIDVVDSLVDVRDELSLLAEQSGNIFATPEWLETWWKHFGSGRMRIRSCRDPDGRLVALVPLYLRRHGPLRVLRFLGHGPSDQLGPVYAPADRPAAELVLREALKAEEFDVFLGEELPGDADWARQGRVYRRNGSPVIHIGGSTWEEFLSSRSREFRKLASRRREDKFWRDFGARFRETDRDRFESDLDTWVALHNQRWGGATLVTGQDLAFHQEFARQAHDRGWARLWFVEFEGRPAAAWYGFCFADSVYAYQSGRDPAFKRFSLGTALELHTIRLAFQEGAREYRLLRGDEAYKYRFASADPGLVSIAVARGMLGRSLLSLRLRVRRNTGRELGGAAPLTRSGDVQDHPSSA